MSRWLAATVAACVLGIASPLAAQTLAGRVEIGVGVLWTGGVALGSEAATETSGTGGRFTLFSTDTSLTGAAGVTARVGASLSRMFQIDLNASYSRPSLSTKVSSDFEQAAPLTASETIHQITVGGSLVVHLWKWRIGSRGVPFVTVGGGYLRQLHQSETLAVSGHTIDAGGGVKLRLRPDNARRRMKSFGISFDLRAEGRQKGVAFDNRLHVAPAATAALFARF